MRAFGVVLIVLGAAAAAGVVVRRDRAGRGARDALAAAAGFALGLGAAAVQADPGAALVLAPLGLGVAGALQAEFLFAPGGPLRTSSLSAHSGVSSGRTMAQTIEEPAQQPPEPSPRGRAARSMSGSRRPHVVVRRISPVSVPTCP